MSIPSKGLSRGLQSLLGTQPRNPDPAGAIPIAAIRPGSLQPRQEIREQPLEELAASIKLSGVIQPIVVRPIAGASAQYEIVAGERRWRAAKLAGLTEIPAVVRSLSDQEAVAVALIENIQREELTPAEEARALKRLSVDFSLTHERLSEVVGRSRAAVSNLLRLLDLPPAVLTLIDEKRLSMGHARALLGLEEDADREQCSQPLSSASSPRGKPSSSSVKDEQGRAMHPESLPSSPVISEVLRTATVHVQLPQKASGASRVIVDLKDPQKRDAVLEAIKRAVE